MSDKQELLKQYLKDHKAVQLATVSNGQPWNCTVSFVADEDNNLYWMSWPERRHSQEIEANERVAVTIPVKFDKPVIGVQAEGKAERVKDPNSVVDVIPEYMAKFGIPEGFKNAYLQGKTKHAMYKFTADKYYLFDEVNLEKDVRHEVE